MTIRSSETSKIAGASAAGPGLPTWTAYARGRGISPQEAIQALVHFARSYEASRSKPNGNRILNNHNVITKGRISE
jgi:hypothetical protein